MKEFNLENLKDSEKIVDFAQMKQIDNLKTKVLKYALYKKRTENEIREKFSEEDENLLEDVIENLKELNYLYYFFPQYWKKLRELQGYFSDDPMKGPGRSIFDLEERFRKRGASMTLKMFAEG